MARVAELAEMLEPLPEVSLVEMEGYLTLVGREASYVAHLAGEIKRGALRREEIPSLLENLAARLTKLASPASPWRGIGCKGKVNR